MNYFFLEPAQAELEDAVRYYESQREGLGEEFALETEATIARIRQLPQIGTALSETVHRARLNRFPYGIVYLIQDQGIIIVAVMHLRRKPGYWMDRLDG